MAIYIYMDMAPVSHSVRAPASLDALVGLPVHFGGLVF